MNIFVYYDLYQEVEFDRIFKDFPDVLSILDERQIEAHRPADYYSFVILLSQPDHKMQKALSNIKWSSILCHIGIRLNESLVREANFFENEHEFKMLMEHALLKQKRNMIDYYFNMLPNIDDSDICYFEQMTGESLAKKNLRKHPLFLKKKIQIQGLITLVGNYEVAAKLSQKIAEKSSKRALIIDGNLMKPSLDSYFKKTNIKTTIQSHLTGIDNTGLNIALDSIAKGISLELVLPKIVQKVSGNLDLLLGNYNIYNYEHYDNASINKFIHKVSELYGLVFLVTSDNPYDSLTMTGFHLSKINIFVCNESSADIRYCSNIIRVLHEKQGLSNEKQIVVTHKTVDQSTYIGNAAISQIFNSMYVGKFCCSNNIRAYRSTINKIVERIKI